MNINGYDTELITAAIFIVIYCAYRVVKKMRQNLGDELDNRID